ncbi:anti-sigma factor domain-containing protein [Cytobacillus gottheilii]|uniref:Anti-sigma factor domain-containing protein n=1 Tax=Cytobacillus gottheilii TaxID=859144 RepID=A0ABX8FGC5_9BACI|nr:anti-sigma factor domain-containing protein [Cytobacillus gottheilii]QVY63061.1 anti-sigma factor domain-containing protein [Cytobacillus gottheilii]
MKKGVIIDIDLDSITLLTPDGDFVKTSNKGQSYLIGEEIEFTSPETLRKGRFSLSSYFTALNRGAVLIATLLIAIITSIAIPFIHDTKTYSYVSIDTESSLEMKLNSENNVIDIVPFNQAGAAVMDNLKEWKNTHIKNVAAMVIVEMNEQGYLETNEPLVIAAVKNGESDNESYDQLQSELLAVKSEIAEAAEVDMEVIYGTLSERKLAKENGLTVGLYKSSAQDEQETKKTLHVQ